ncbi:substrate-binding domain-containing protein [Sphingobacterium sp. SRCM116780]|uniref:molybdate ABC transporter substrate-binding protein n=1 Tax=Sphingobacterium sp. SRCM116780 TaxID=2907623 RepID=UPI001F3523E0|nr:substrate-binding domain-containing protein [Sphingobacterium sp. SRCM116780]UIR56320.1 substrate-binding domain-containing protein [Sphingobacterium sp. SRCM116780]
MKRLLRSILVLLVGINAVHAQDYQFHPPWNTPPESAVNFTIPGIDNIPDLYGEIENPQLVIFFAGNQFMVIDDLIKTFKKEYPQYERIFVETLPPGILAKQIQGGSLTIGNLKITHTPDVYTAGQRRITEMGDYFDQTITYATNKLTLMVPKGNPKNIQSLRDLQRKDVRISMPNPAWEGVGEQIKTAYRKVGGEELVRTIMEEKVADKTTYLTKIHHRESPLRILEGHADVAPVWYSEAAFQKMINHPIESITIPDNENITAKYMAGKLKKSKNKQAGIDFMAYLQSESAQDIYKKYGFEIPKK